MKKLEIGSTLWKINHGSGYGYKDQIREVEIIGETATRWKLPRDIQLNKKDLTVYGDKWSREYYVQEKPTERIKKNSEIDRANDFKRNLERFVNDTRRTIDFTEEMNEIYKVLKGLYDE